MRKHTLLFSCLVLGGTLFAFVGFYFGFWQSGEKQAKEPPRQVVVSEGAETVVAPLPKVVDPKTGKDPLVEAAGPSTVRPSESDQFGYGTSVPVAATVRAAGAKVLQLPEFETFAAYWLPKEVKVERMLVLLHDERGLAYEELSAELASAEANGYGLLALQWYNKSTDTHQRATQVYRSLSVLLDWFNEEGVQPRVRTLLGFGRASTAAFEVLSLDRSGRRFFASSVHVSGGIPVDGILSSDASARPDPFFVSLIVGQAAADLYTNVRFYMYCGRLDEHRGGETCEEMNHAQSIAVKYGGTVDAFAISDVLGRRGLRGDPTLYRDFITWFTSL